MYDDGGLLPKGMTMIAVPVDECVIPASSVCDRTWTCGRRDIAHLNASHGGDWMVVEDDDEVNVIPCGDTLSHGGRHCLCEPTIEEYERVLVVHNARDGRP
ncbi:hypothetical protein SEA_VANLEE_93 [Gordonia phage VanLee]|uniref:Uncharacterized protein n=1 Tax=Gordonia phage VanLee TaxID=2845816 RepID=A0A8F2DA66_9CAUD|nr:hypothetical protein QEH49_gp093 [Gordonia phage VanLee]QWS68210.1 hypothetical protein SEA_VANLEE_93 [Gordonia phage VanLee]